jgi:excisionase family DNA binding protein
MTEPKEIIVEANPGDKVIINVMNSLIEKEHYSLAEFSKLSNLSRTTLYRKIKNNEIPIIRIGKSKKIEHKYLQQFKK